MRPITSLFCLSYLNDNSPPTAATDGSVHGSGDSSVLWAEDEDLIVIKRADISYAALTTGVTTPGAELQTRA